MNDTIVIRLKDFSKLDDAEGLIAAVLGIAGEKRLVLASSLSVEDQVLTHMFCNIAAKPRIFTLDTGRLFPETYETMERTMDRYKFRYETVVPDTVELEKMLAAHGPNLFYNSIDLRHECCRVRKVGPLRRLLATADAWICGLRREQAVTRNALSAVEPDPGNDIIKINPLRNWPESQVWDYVKKHDIPYNPLQDCGFRSIGCQPCTRAIGTNDDLRAGRWWWESAHHKECGLHNRPLQ